MLQNKKSWGRTALSSTQDRVLNVFFAVTVIGTFLALLGIVLYYIFAFAAQSLGSHAFDWLLGIFSDFVAIMSASISGSPYLQDGASYPPFAIAILYPFAWLCRTSLADYAGASLSVDELTARMVCRPQFWISYILFFLLCTSLVLFAVLKRYRPGAIPSLKLCGVTVLSAPFVYAVMRGNVIYFALIFLLFFLLWHEHKNAVLRELSYFSLALAGMIKIYPLFFGVFLLHKRRWFASCRVAIYFALGTFLSFFLYRDGLDNFGPFLKQLGSFMNEGERLLSERNLSLPSTLFKLFYNVLPAHVLPSFFRYASLAVFLSVFAVATITASYTKSTFSRSVIAASVVVLLPSISYFYVLIFMLIPFFEFLKSYDMNSPKNRCFYTVLFLFLFLAPTILAANFLIHALIVLLMLSVEIRNVFKKEILPALAAKKEQRKNGALR